MRDENACHSVKGSIFIQPSTPPSQRTPSEYDSISVWALSFPLFPLLNLSFSIFSLLLLTLNICLCLFVFKIPPQHPLPIPGTDLVICKCNEINILILIWVFLERWSVSRWGRGVQNHAWCDIPMTVLFLDRHNWCCSGTIIRADQQRFSKFHSFPTARNLE